MRADVKESLDAWAATGRPTGGFLRAVLENDLSGAIARADSDNLRDLVEIVQYVWNHLPTGCWGSRERMVAWVAKKVLEIDANILLERMDSGSGK